MFNIFKTKKISVWFDSAESMHKFEKTIVLDTYVSSNTKRGDIIEVTCGFEDEHCEVVYPIKWDKVNDFRRFVEYFDFFFDTTNIKLLG